LEASHETTIKQALFEGKPVPKEVLDQYPDLAQKTNVAGEGKDKYPATIEVGEGENGGKIIHSSASNTGKIQVTSFTENGEPKGHLQFDSIEEASVTDS
jgi:hypothetical protein